MNGAAEEKETSGTVNCVKNEMQRDTIDRKPKDMEFEAKMDHGMGRTLLH